MAQTDGTGTLGKAMHVVQVIADAQTPPRFRDLEQMVEQPKGTLHRQISNLIEEGLVELRPDQTYGLGMRLMSLASRSWERSKFREVAEPHLHQLHRETGETVHLGVLRGIEVFYLDKVESVQSVRMHSQIGHSSPCYCTGVGKAALSVLPRQTLSPLIDRIAFQRFTDSTIISGKALEAELDEIRQTGIAFDNQEHEAGIHCIAAPIFNSDRSLVAGISITAPVFRVAPSKLTQWSELIAASADAIVDDIKIRMGPKP
ncbi:MAG: IclR family transcriptional regulator [Pseudomonadota bacterium]